MPDTYEIKAADGTVFEIQSDYEIKSENLIEIQSSHYQQTFQDDCYQYLVMCTFLHDLVIINTLFVMTVWCRKLAWYHPFAYLITVSNITIPYLYWQTYIQDKMIQNGASELHNEALV